MLPKVAGVFLVANCSSRYVIKAVSFRHIKATLLTGLFISSTVECSYAVILNVLEHFWPLVPRNLLQVPQTESLCFVLPGLSHGRECTVASED